MSLDKWPFKPARLTEIMDSNQVELLGLAISRLIPHLAIVCFFEKDNEDNIVQITSEDIDLREKSWTPFCSMLRGRNKNGIIQPRSRFKNGDSACSKNDLWISRLLLENAANIPNLYIPYRCHMGLCEFGAVVYVSNVPVGVMLTGQLPPQEQELKDAIKERINYLEEPEKKMVHWLPENIKTGKHGIPFLQVNANPKAKVRLIKCVDRLKNKDNGRVPELLNKQAQKIGEIAEGHYNLKKRIKLEEFKRELYEPFCGGQGDLTKGIQLLLEKIKIFTSSEWVGLFGDREYITGNVLDLIAISGFQSESIVADWPHINWKGIERHIIDENEKTHWLCPNLLDEALRHKTGNSHFTIEKMKKANVWISHEHTNGAKTILVFKGLEKSCVPDAEKHFLDDLAHLIGERFVYRAEYLRREKMSETAKEVASLIAHQVRASLTPIRTGIDWASTLVKDRTDKNSLECSKTLEKLDVFIEDLARHSSMNLESLRNEIDYFYRFKPEQFMAVNLESLCASIKVEFAQKAREKDLFFNIRSTNTDSTVLVVPEAMQTVYFNLFDNEIKYSRPGTHINISFDYNRFLPYFSSEISIKFNSVPKGEVLDTELDKIFERGYQGKNANSEEGCGLGLWEIRNIILSHKGSITAHNSLSKKSEKILTFIIRLPLTRSGNKKTRSYNG